MMPAFDAFAKLELRNTPEDGSFHTIAGFALHILQRIPVAGDQFQHDGWEFEVVDMDGMRIDKILAKRKEAKIINIDDA